MSHDDFAFEPVPGLPENLPEGERILWQGAPHWQSLAWRVYHVREVTAYFGVLMAWRGFSTWWETQSAPKAAAAFISLLPPALLTIAILGVMAWLCGRMTVYTLTDRRLVMRIGTALPTTFNLPFARVVAASVKPASGGRGDIGVTLGKDDKLAYLVLWPHARPWKLLRPEPTMRCVPDCAHVAGLLTGALQATPDSAANGAAQGDKPLNSRGQAQEKLTQHGVRRDVLLPQGLTAAGL